MIFYFTVWVIRFQQKIIKNSLKFSTLKSLATIELLFLGLFFQSNDKPDFPLTTSTMVLGISYYAGNFFAEKMKRLHEDRMLETKEVPLELVV